MSWKKSQQEQLGNDLIEGGSQTVKPSVDVYMIKSIHSATFIQGKYGIGYVKNLQH